MMNKLTEIEKRNPFKVPVNYFADINMEIMDKLPEKTVEAPRKISMWDKSKSWLYMAAMFAGLFFVIQFLFKNTTSTENMPEQAANVQYTQNNDYWSGIQISEEEFYQYLESQFVRDDYYDYMYNHVSLN